MENQTQPNPVSAAKTIAQLIYEHLFEDGGTPNDGTTYQLYRESFGLEGQDVDLESVEEWAIDKASRYATKHGLPLNNGHDSKGGAL
jgi:hypothetical protein